MKAKKGQNIVEYILLAVAVILVFLVILNPQSGPLKNSVERTINSTVDKINELGQNNSNTIRFQ